MIQFIQTTPEQLQNNIAEQVRKELLRFLEVYKPKQPNDYLTRKQVCDMLDIHISTLHNWCKSGKLQPLAISNRVYFLRSEIEQSLIRLNS